jgi:RNA polymerase primary sigma factor
VQPRSAQPAGPAAGTLRVAFAPVATPALGVLPARADAPASARADADDGAARVRRERAPARRRVDARDAGALDRYLSDIGRFPLLTREREIELARRVRDGDRDALDALVRANLRFVVSVAKKYQHQGMALDDLVAEGNVGLLRAVHKYDETKGVRFISYAVWWIRRNVLQALADQGRIVRVPVNRAGTLHRIVRCANLLRQELGREPTHAEIAEALNLTGAEVAESEVISQVHLSLDAPLGDDDDARLLDYLADEHSATSEEQATERALADAVAASLAVLKERESRTLQRYFGLDGDEPMTLDEIGAELGISRERARQIKENALSRLRHAPRARSLAGFLG